MMECRVNIWLTMECKADAKYAARDVEEKMQKAWERKRPYDFFCTKFDYENGDVEACCDEVNISALTARDITKDDAIAVYAYFTHMEHAKRFVMEVEDDERFFYAIFSNEGNRLVMEYLPRKHYPEAAIDENGVDIDILMDALDKYKVTKVIAIDKGNEITPC